MARLRTATLRAAIAGALLVSCSGCFYFHQHFVEAQRAETAGYRIEHLQAQHLLFVHRPDGSTDGVDLAHVRFVALHRIRPQDSIDGKPRYWWQFGMEERVVSAPFFGAEPLAIIAILTRTLREFDAAQATRSADEFEHDKADFCLLWASEAHLQQQGKASGPGCRPGH